MSHKNVIRPAKDKEKYVRERVRYWRKRLGINPKIKLTLKFVTNEDPVEQKYATIDRDMMEYHHATMEIYDEVFSSPNFKKAADKAVCHEVLHLALHPLVAYCYNMFTDDPGKQKETERLEEQVITELESSLTDY